MRQQHCVLWVLNDSSSISNHSNEEDEEDGVGQGELCKEDVDALIMRYEAPDERNRWDKPLFKIDLSSSSSFNHNSGVVLPPSPEKQSIPALNINSSSTSSEQTVLYKSVYNMHKLNESLLLDEAVTTTLDKDSIQKKIGIDIDDDNEHDDKHALVQRVDEFLNRFLNESSALVENNSTKKVVTAKLDVLHDTDRITQQIALKVMNAQKTQGGYGCTTVTLANNQNIILDRDITQNDMRKFRRQFIKWIGLHPPDDCSEDGVTLAFLSYIQTQL